MVIFGMMLTSNVNLILRTPVSCYLEQCTNCVNLLGRQREQRKCRAPDFIPVRRMEVHPRLPVVRACIPGRSPIVLV